MSSAAGALFPVPLTPRLSVLVSRLETLRSGVDVAVDSAVEEVMEAWGALKREFNAVDMIANATEEIRLFLFSTWAVQYIRGDILAFVCQRLYGRDVERLNPSDKSRLNALAVLLSSPANVVLFVMKKQVSNNNNIKAFRVLCGMPNSLTLAAFYQRAEIICCQMATVDRAVKRASVVRETLQNLGATEIWGGSQASSDAGGSPRVIPSIEANIPPVPLFPPLNPPPQASTTSGAQRRRLPRQARPELAYHAPARPSSQLSQSFAGLDDQDLQFDIASPEGARPASNAPMFDQSSVAPSASSDGGFGGGFIDVESGIDFDADEDLQQTFPPVFVEKSPTPQVSCVSSLVAPLDELVESINRRLAPGQWLNDNIVNTALFRLASANVGIVDSLSVRANPSPRLVERLHNIFTTKSAVLIPVCDEGSNHWRLYCWRMPSTLDVLDSSRVMPDNTTEMVKQFVVRITKGVDVELSSIECSQQANGFDCGIFTIQFAQLIASGNNPATSFVLFDSDSVRANIGFNLLTSNEATPPPWKPSTPLLPLLQSVRSRLVANLALAKQLNLTPNSLKPEVLDMATNIQILRHGINTLHLNHKSSLTMAIKTEPIESMPAFFGIVPLRVYVANRQSAIGKPGAEDYVSTDEGLAQTLDIIKKMEAGMKIVRGEYQARYGKCVALVLVLRYARKKFDALEMELDIIRRPSGSAI
ncbi:hypothetical protein ACHAPU_011438 [Fusarium lateritium]